eukprot:3167116-Rhodomonas_salina.2
MKALKAWAAAARGRRFKVTRDNKSAASAATFLPEIKTGDSVLYLDKSGGTVKALVDQVDSVNQPPTYLIKFANNAFRETERNKLCLPARNQDFTNGSDDVPSEGGCHSQPSVFRIRKPFLTPLA